MENVTVQELIQMLEQELIRNGYEKNTLRYYRRCWKGIEEYFVSRGETHFSEVVAMDYIDSVCGFRAKEKAERLTASDIYLYRIVRTLSDFQRHGVILRRYLRRMPYQGSAEDLHILDQFSAHCQKVGYAVVTQKGYRRTAERFMNFLRSRSLTLQAIDAGILADHLKTLTGYTRKTMEYVLCGMRAFLRFLYANQYLPTDFSDLLPSVNAHRQTRIPTIWNHDDFLKMVEAIDRGNPTGKRDYAMIMLVARLGIRSVDVKRLIFENFKWTENELVFSQSKTGRPVSLPLLPDVGWAVIDYLQNGRPASDSPYVFLHHNAPIAPFTQDNHLHHTIVKYMRLAKLSAGEKTVGMHSLRHTLATSLMERHTPLPEISEILGHQNVESTTVYLKSSVDLLRECALNPEVE